MYWPRYPLLLALRTKTTTTCVPPRSLFLLVNSHFHLTLHKSLVSHCHVLGTTWLTIQSSLLNQNKFKKTYMNNIMDNMRDGNYAGIILLAGQEIIRRQQLGVFLWQMYISILTRHLLFTIVNRHNRLPVLTKYPTPVSIGV